MYVRERIAAKKEKSGILEGSLDIKENVLIGIWSAFRQAT